MNERDTLKGIDAYSVLDSISDATVMINTEGIVLFINKEARKLACLTDPALATGASFFKTIPLPWRNIAEFHFTSIIETGAPATVDISFCDPQGRKNYFEIKGSAIPDSGNNVAQVLIEARDVTSQKIFENKITSVAREQSNLIEHANAVIIGTDARGYITEWNNMAAKIIGYTKNEIYTKRLLDLLPWKEFYTSFSDTMQAAMGGEVITNYEAGIRDRDGKKLTFLVNVTPRRSPAGEVIGLLMIGQDITELWEYKKNLELKVQERTEALHKSLQKEKKLVDLKNRFVSIASHEFKVPLSGIMRNVAHLKTYNGSLTAAETTSRLENIATQTKHMLMLLEDVLTIGKTEAGQMKANIQPVDLSTFLAGIIEEVQNSTGNTHSIRFDCPLKSLQILSDEKLLRNVFINLLNNAIKFSPAENEVFLAVSVGDSFVEITVRDKGIGIAAKDLALVFEPFNRGSNAQKIIGTGLGLSIVKKAVEALKGKMDVKSRVGEGTAFTIKLELDP
jgi:PAS domain S-box-containing protein